MNKLFYTILPLFLIFVSCSKQEGNAPNKGEIVVVADESFRNVTTALAERYMAFYPDTKINVRFQKEDYALADLLKQNVRVIVMSRDLTEKERKLYKEMIDIPLQPAKFAGDATVFIAAKNSKRNFITVDEIRKELLSDSRKMIFDGANTGNFNFVAQILNIKPKDVKFSVIKGNEEIINQISKYPESIGVISFNSISNPYTKEAAELRDKIKILPIVDDKGDQYLPTQENIRTMRYPFTRVLYFLTNEGYFGLGNGFIRFSCTQVGQIVVSKEGLQPFYIFKREVQMR